MKRVLVIDSENSHSVQARRRLEADGYAAIECNTGNEALEFFRSGTDVVILSQQVSELDVEFWRELRGLSPVPSVVVVPKTAAGPFEGTTLDDLREGGVYVTSPNKASDNRGYELPPKGINFYDLERNLLCQALTHCHGNQTRAGMLLGLSRDQIRYRMAKFGLTSTGFQSGSSPAAA
jgi:DNA-binding NtrC family response regulator